MILSFSKVQCLDFVVFMSEFQRKTKAHCHGRLIVKTGLCGSQFCIT